jgi:hypothetical protein
MSEQQQAETVNKYHKLLADLIASGGAVIPISQCGLIKSGSFSSVTVQKWIDKGKFPFIKIGFRRYTSDSIIAQWIADGQSDEAVFGCGQRRPGRDKGDNPFAGITPWERKRAERQRLIDDGLIEPEELPENEIDDADLYRVD